MKKILLILIGVLFVSGAYSAQIANVEYVHKMIEQTWDITVPYNSALNSVKQIANMKYLLSAIDVANHMINSNATTNYSDGEFATNQIVDTDTVNTAVETLITNDSGRNYKFFITTIPDTTSFGFYISAMGEFYVDWGDGKTNKIIKKDTSGLNYTHNYTTAGTYIIKIGGKATAYTDYTEYEKEPAISFSKQYNPRYTEITHAQKIASIDGSLGAIFGTLADGSQPQFYRTFIGASNISGSIPENLFAGISGAPVSYMFYRTFRDCTGLTGSSARINGQYLYEIWPDYATSNQFEEMYYNATGLSDFLYIPVAWGGFGATTNEYPSAPSDAVYDFYLTTTSDTDVFAMKISAAGEFYIDWGDGKSEWITKSDTTNMTFGHKYASKGGYNIRLGGQATAYNTSTTTAAIRFHINLSPTKIASIDGSLGAIFGTLSSDTNNQPRFYNTFYNATNMTGSIPENLFAGISGAPAEGMFFGTFYGCSGLTGAIPSGLFGNLSGAPAGSMFDSTFDGCSGLTGAIPDGLFGNLTGAPASFMFAYTFKGCSGLTSIPENLFGNISGTAQSAMFRDTFYNCTSLTGPSARINGQYLYKIWPNATLSQVGGMYRSATGLSDYANIPSAWK